MSDPLFITGIGFYDNFLLPLRSESDELVVSLGFEVETRLGAGPRTRPDSRLQRLIFVVGGSSGQSRPLRELVEERPLLRGGYKDLLGLPECTVVVFEDIKFSASRVEQDRPRSLVVLEATLSLFSEIEPVTGAQLCQCRENPSSSRVVFEFVGDYRQQNLSYLLELLGVTVVYERDSEY